MSERILKSPKLQIINHYKRLMRNYYLGARYAHLWGRKIAWITSGAPVEILYAMGIIPVYPENHGAICGASGASLDLCKATESIGYSQDLCSYMRCDIGSTITSQGPIGQLPRPDFLVCCNNICGTVMKWFQIQSEYYKVPLFLLDTPFVHDELKPHVIEYVKNQMDELVCFLETYTQKQFKEAKLKKIIVQAKESVQLWKDILSLNKNKPAPLSCFDAFINMAPIVTMRGTRKIIRFYKRLKKELEVRVAMGTGAISEERYRLLWDNIPIWGEIRNLFNTLMMNGANLVVDSYTTAWALDKLDTNKPIDSMAETYLNVHLNLGLESKIKKMIQLIEDFSIDGFIMHSNRSCKPYSLGQYDIKNIVMERTGIQGLIIEADMTDPRAYFDAQTKTKLAAFMEML